MAEPEVHHPVRPALRYPEQCYSGMGFTFMELFMDELEVESAKGKGTTVRMIKQIGGNEK